MVLFSVKLLLAIQSASLAIIYPFINLHMFSLGFSRAQITQTNIIICASDIIVPLLTGVLADKVENFRYCRILDLRTALRSRETTIYNCTTSMWEVGGWSTTRVNNYLAGSSYKY